MRSIGTSGLPPPIIAPALSHKYPLPMNMRVYVLRRLLQGALTLLLVSIAIFAALRAAPGDAADLIAAGGSGAEAAAQAGSEDQIAALREDLGLNRPLWRQYAVWLSDMVTLDWGDSFVTGRSVWDEFLNRLPVTLQLSLMGIAVAVLLGVPLGVAAALRQDTWVDYAVRVFSLGGVSLPHFWLATLVLLAGVRFFTWSPPPRLSAAPHRAIGQPDAVPLAGAGAGVLRRGASHPHDPLRRAGGHAPGVRPHGAREGPSPRRRRPAPHPAQRPAARHHRGRHRLRNAHQRSVVLEQVFALPGTGLYLLDAVKLRDYAVVQPVIVFFAAWVVLVNLTVDMLYTWLNPQVRYG